jgi:membrane-associated phospholipid phosphatase
VGIIAVARLAKGAHWPLDVAAGIVLGFVSETLSSRVLRGLGVPPSRKDDHAAHA